MDKNQVKHLLLSISEESFIDWYNNNVVDPFGDFAYATIRKNDGAEIYDFAKETFDLEVFVKMCADSCYSEDDEYCLIQDTLISFNSIEELLDMANYGEGIVDFFLDDEEENRKAILELLAAEKSE